MKENLWARFQVSFSHELVYEQNEIRILKGIKEEIDILTEEIKTDKNSFFDQIKDHSYEVNHINLVDVTD